MPALVYSYIFHDFVHKGVHIVRLLTTQRFVETVFCVCVQLQGTCFEHRFMKSKIFK